MFMTFDKWFVSRARRLARKRTVLGAAALLSILTAGAKADESLKGIACRSVHLGYSAPEGDAFYIEMSVEKSSEGSYFMAAGWSKGYFGVQELANGRKLVLFSVWDPASGDDPRTVDESKRVKLLYKDEAVRVQRFGGEGTGGQSFLDYPWKMGHTYRFLVTAASEGAERTAYTSWFFIPESGKWKRLVTFSTITGGVLLDGLYSFVEDFRRNRLSATKERRSILGNGWSRTTDGKWRPLAEARFTADANPAENIDAGVSDSRFFLATGGDVRNETTPLHELISIHNPQANAPPADLPEIRELPSP